MGRTAQADLHTRDEINSVVTIASVVNQHRILATQFKGVIAFPARKDDFRIEDSEKIIICGA